VGSVTTKIVTRSRDAGEANYIIWCYCLFILLIVFKGKLFLPGFLALNETASAVGATGVMIWDAIPNILRVPRPDVTLELEDVLTLLLVSG